MKKVLISFLILFLLILVLSAAVAFLWKDDGVGSAFSDKVALVNIEGPIFESDELVKEIRERAEDSSIKAIILRINSPGGAVAPSQEIFTEVKRAKEKKKVVTSMGSLAASGGYYIAAPSDRIIANPGTLTGSIGVIMEIPNLETLMDKVGVKTEVIKSGQHKDMASAFRKMTPEDRAILQAVIDDVHDQFVKDVASSRKIDMETLRKLADGRIFTGQQALKAGLVDELGGLEHAIEVTAKLAGIDGKPTIVEKSKDDSLASLIGGMFKAGGPALFPHLRIQYMMTP